MSETEITKDKNCEKCQSYTGYPPCSIICKDKNMWYRDDKEALRDKCCKDCAFFNEKGCAVRSLSIVGYCHLWRPKMREKINELFKEEEKE